MIDTASPGRGRRDLVLLLVVLLGGAAVRLAYFLEIRDTPEFTHPAVDALTHDYWARALVSGDWTTGPELANPRIHETSFFRPPGYPYFLAAVYALTGGSYAAACLVQMTLGLLSAGLGFAIGRRWFGSAAGLLAAAGIALYWGAVYFEGELQAEPLFATLLLASLYCFARWGDERRWRDAIAGGVALGLGALLRPNALLLVPVAAVWVGWRAGSRRRGIRVAVAVALAAFAAIVPATGRNFVVAREFVLISSNTGINLYIGNNERANGFCLDEIPGLGTFGTCFDYARLVQRLEERLGRKLTYAQASDWFTAQSFAFIRAHPLRFTQLLVRKFFLLWGPAEVGHNKVDALERSHSRVLRALPGNFPSLTALALLGFAVVLRQRRSDARAAPRWPPTVLLASFVLVLAGSIVPFFVAARYRVPLVPFLVLLASTAIVQLVQRFRDGRHRMALGWVVATAGVGGLLCVAPVRYEVDTARWHFDRGAARLAAGNVVDAEAEFQTAVQLQPAYYQARYNLATLLARRGDLRRAALHWQEIIRNQPDSGPAHSSLGAALLALGDVPQALEHLHTAVRLQPQHAPTQLSLAGALQRAGQAREAAQHFEAALALEPTNLQARLQLANTLVGLGNALEALTHYERILGAGGDSKLENDVANNMAWILATHADAKVRNAARALALATRSCENTSFTQARYLDTLAAAQAENGRFADAVATIDKAIARTQGDTGTLEARQKLYAAQRPYRDVRP